MGIMTECFHSVGVTLYSYILMKSLRSASAPEPIVAASSFFTLMSSTPRPFLHFSLLITSSILLLSIFFLCFAYDIALLAESPNELQAMVNRVVEVSENLGMKVNIEKTEIQHLGKAHEDFNIVIKKQNLKQTVNFVYLGENLSSKEGTI